MDTLLILDVETDGLSAKNNQVIEIGAILYDINSKSIIQQVSTLILTDRNAAEHINHISVPSLECVNDTIKEECLCLIELMMNNSNAIMAHNAVFDKAFIFEFGFPLGYAKTMKWICSKSDISWPKSDSLKLVDIAKAMGVNNTAAHRALSDCIILAECLSKLPNLKEQLETLESKHIYKANIAYEDKHIAKEAGFYFNADLRRWEKKLTPKQASLIKFSISKVDGEQIDALEER